MGNTLVGLSGFQRGIEAAETGVNIDNFSVRYFPQYKDKVNNYAGQAIGFAIPDKFTREATLSGEVSSIGSLTGVMAAVLNAAYTFANDVGTWVAVTSGSNAGGFYFDEFTEAQTRDGFRTFNAKATADPLNT